ncbi:NUDIX domain-containing protein [Myxococcota bacterium]|nr:NUDIX domain-containing protein [Myxococcota bacterium]
MNALVLLNAGGAGTRMGGPTPKALYEVRGVPLVERNLLRALGAGARSVVLVTAPAGEGLRAWAASRGRALCDAAGARFEVVVEASPRGTAACLGCVDAGTQPVMMLYADNLTALDLAAFDAAHAATGADLTVASHEESFDVPFGQLRCAGDRLVAYVEKPRLPLTVASGAYLVSPAARASIPPEGWYDAPTLVNARVAAGVDVRIFPHAATWMDVNDRGALARAETLLSLRPALERFVEAPAREVCGVVLLRGDAVLLERRPPDAALSPGLWDTPGGKLEPGETAAVALRRELAEELALDALTLRPLAVFDDLDPTGKWLRHHVFAAEFEAAPVAVEGQHLGLFRRGALPAPLASPARRSLAYFDGTIDDTVGAPEPSGGRHAPV